MLYNAFKHAPLHQHALVPFGFRRWVSWWLTNTSLVLPVCDRDISKRLTAHTGRTSFQGSGSPASGSFQVWLSAFRVPCPSTPIPPVALPRVWGITPSSWVLWQLRRLQVE